MLELHVGTDTDEIGPYRFIGGLIKHVTKYSALTIGELVLMYRDERAI